VEDIFSDRLDLCLVAFDFLPEPVSGSSDRKLEACVAQEAIMKGYVVVLMRDVVAGCVSSRLWSREVCTGAKALNESYVSSSRTKRTVLSQQ
jgi:hypothetical protein